jgi:Xaa-Pro aminopeptidase
MYHSDRSEKASLETLLPISITDQPSNDKAQRLRKPFLGAAAAALCCLMLVGSTLPSCWHNGTSNSATQTSSHSSSVSDDFLSCSIENFEETGYPFLDGVHPITTEEFVARRQRLAQALISDGADAFAVEPGYTFSYYANITQQQWEVWEPEERPFLMMIQPDGSEKAKTTFLVPSFEAERARLLGMPFADDEDITWVTYEEHWDPYATLASSKALSPLQSEGSEDAAIKIIIDEEMRDFIARGLATQSSFDVAGLGGDVERVRQIKAPAEVDILRAVNTGTVEAIRAMRPCLQPGLTENDVASVLDSTLRSASLEPFFDIVLFDEDASNPHGGTDGSKKLTNTTMVLIDVGAHLYGYSSDVCRSFFPPFTSTDNSTWDANIEHKIAVWHTVFEAQTKSLSALTLGHAAADVDIAARRVIEDAGYGDAFTHRVGHGIGIKAHESPYLNKGNVDTPLRAGMTFTSEPGVYLVEKFGVRHEDVLLVKEQGLPDVLSGKRATDPFKP